MDLWKTFATWATLGADKTINPAKTDFRLFAVVNYFNGQLGVEARAIVQAMIAERDAG